MVKGNTKEKKEKDPSLKSAAADAASATQWAAKGRLVLCLPDANNGGTQRSKAANLGSRASGGESLLSGFQVGFCTLPYLVSTLCSSARRLSSRHLPDLQELRVVTGCMLCDRGILIEREHFKPNTTPSSRHTVEQCHGTTPPPGQRRD